MGCRCCSWKKWILIVVIALLLGGCSVLHAEEPSPVDQLRRSTAQRFDFKKLREAGKRLRQGNYDLSGLKQRSWKVGNQKREALIWLPPTATTSTPIIFVFHGHGGTSAYAARTFGFHKCWPEAICIYPQGLPTPVPLLDPNGKFSGWQKSIGDQQDRDIEFFDTMLAALRKERKIDPNQIYVAGHSNGGFFAYVLWAARGDELAAIAPVAALNVQRDIQRQKPLPVMHIAGERDSIVPYQFQLGTMNQLRHSNDCEATGKEIDERQTEYTSKKGSPVVTFIHSGGHEIPAEAPEQIVKFFQQHPKQ